MISRCITFAALLSVLSVPHAAAAQATTRPTATGAVVAGRTTITLPDTSAYSAAQRRILALERERSAAIERRDTAWLATLYAPDFRGVPASGVRVDRAALFRIFARDDPRRRSLIDELEVRDFGGGLATVTGRLRTTSEDGQAVGELRYLRVYAQRAGQWWIVAAQGTPVAGAAASDRSVVAADSGYVAADDGVRLFYQRIGTGKNVVIAPARLFLVDDFTRLEAPDRTLIFYDMRNRGRSDAVTDTLALTIQKDVADLERVRRHFRADRASLIGYSYLGLMVVMYAMEHPTRVERIVQIGAVPRKFGTKYPRHLTANDSAPVYDSAAVERARRLRESGYARTHPREYCEIVWSINRFGLVGNPANVEKLGKGVCEMPNEHPINFARHLQYHFTSVQRLDVPVEAVRRLRVPVLTIHGTKDRNADYGAGREWAHTLPNARLLTVPGAAHAPWVEFPETVFPAIDTFLRGGWPSGVERVAAAR